MKTIWVVQYNDGTADVFDEDQGPPSWPYVDAFEAKQRIAELERINKVAFQNGVESVGDKQMFDFYDQQKRITELERTAQYWKDEHLAGNKRIAELEAQVPSDGGAFELALSDHLDETCGAYSEILAAHNADRAADKQRIAELEDQLKKARGDA